MSVASVPTQAPSSPFSTAGLATVIAFITDQHSADVAPLELRYRRRARVEDAIRVGKETMRRMPLAAFAHNQAWLEVSLAAQALPRWRRCSGGRLALT